MRFMISGLLKLEKSSFCYRQSKDQFTNGSVHKGIIDNAKSKGKVNK